MIRLLLLTPSPGHPPLQELEDLEGMLFGSGEGEDKVDSKAPAATRSGDGDSGNPDQWGCSEVAAFVQALGKGA